MKFSAILLILAGGLIAGGCRHTYEPAPAPYYCQPNGCGCAQPCCAGMQSMQSLSQPMCSRHEALPDAYSKYHSASHGHNALYGTGHHRDAGAGILSARNGKSQS